MMPFLLAPGQAAGYTIIRVVDFFTGESIKGALVTLNNGIVPANGNDKFIEPSTGGKLRVRAHGYMITEQIITAPLIPTLRSIRLIPFNPKALYLSFYGIGERSLRESALKLIQETELNALVIDVKGDRGMISYKSSIPLASEIGAQRIITVKDIGGLIKSLKGKGIYTIARIVVFKDNLLALGKSDLAMRTQSGEIWRDRENLAWVDPFKKEVWEYNINIAVEAAQYGFDEIQFDYVRFPDASAPRFSMANTEENRVRAISGFLMEAKQRLIPYNVFLAADIFGYVCWNFNDTFVGQRLDALVPHLDYLSPMLYPSGFQYGIPGYRIPVENPYEIVYLSLKRAQERTNLPAIRFRPWLQAFRDYAFDRRPFNGKEIRDQIEAAGKFGSQGWMLWNPGNIYSAQGLKRGEPIGWLTSLVPHPKI
ncbi:MAG: putative glycoside hydrolase [Deltaproteobacteria bacterium]|nr:putative glycoside hydrolase [Deltaproteobacteria bacterium]